MLWPLAPGKLAPAGRTFSVEKGVVAIWLGKLEAEAELEAYLSEKFRDEFGMAHAQFGAHGLPRPETFAGEAQPIRDLLGRFSLARRFLDAAVGAAANNGIESASCAVVFYAHRYDGTASSGTGLSFFGNFKLTPKEAKLPR